MKIFISHSEVDKEFSEKIIDLLQSGMNVYIQNIFCSSVGNISIGEEFTQVIKENLLSSKVVICVITQHFLSSKFCLCELGASWILNKVIIPIIVPPLTYSDIDSLPIRNLQCVKADSYDGFINIFQKLQKEKIIDNVNLSRFITKLNIFFNNQNEVKISHVLNYNELIEGKLSNLSVQIGTVESEVIRELGLPNHKGTIGGSTFYMYDNVTLFFDLKVKKTSRVISIGKSGKGLTKHQIIHLLGEPNEDSWSNLNSEWYILYEIDKYSLRIGFITNEKNISKLSINSASYYTEYLLATHNSNKVSYITLSYL